MSTGLATETSPASMTGTLVIHETNGVGRVESNDGQGRVSIRVGRSSSMPLLRASRDSVGGKGALFEAIENEDPCLVLSMSEERFLNHPEWTLAPSKARFLRVCNEIQTSYSQVVVPTLNPPNPIGAKGIVEARVHKMLLQSPRPVYDDLFNALRSQLTFLLDSQLSFYLIRGDESYRSYQVRLEAFGRAVESGRAWSSVLYREADLDANERVIQYAKALVHMTVEYHGVSYSSAVHKVVEMFEARIKLYRTSILGFTRSRNKRR